MDFSPLDFVKDTIDFIRGKDSFTGGSQSRLALGAAVLLPGCLDATVKSVDKTIDIRTGYEVQRFIADNKGNVMIEPVGGKTGSAGKKGIDTHTLYPNGSNYQRFNPYGHPPKSTISHGHGHLPDTGPGMKGQGPSIDINGNIVPWDSGAAHWPTK